MIQEFLKEVIKLKNELEVKGLAVIEFFLSEDGKMRFRAYLMKERGYYLGEGQSIYESLENLRKDVQAERLSAKDD